MMLRLRSIYDNFNSCINFTNLYLINNVSLGLVHVNTRYDEDTISAYNASKREKQRNKKGGRRDGDTGTVDMYDEDTISAYKASKREKQRRENGGTDADDTGV